MENGIDLALWLCLAVAVATVVASTLTGGRSRRLGAGQAGLPTSGANDSRRPSRHAA